MDLRAKEYYYIRYAGEENDHMVFEIGVDDQEVKYKFFIDRNNDILRNGVIWAFHTQPSRTDAEYTEEHNLMFDDVSNYLEYVLKHYNILDGEGIRCVIKPQ